MYDLIIVGGGPAGLTAAVYALRKRLEILLVSMDLGGKTNYHLELPGEEQYQVIRGVEVVDKFKNELEYLNFARHMEPVQQVEKVKDYFLISTKGGGELKAKAVIIATGARQKLMDVPGEREYLSKGLCYSAMSYAPLFIDKKTVVIGDGMLAMRSAAELATIAKHVDVVGPVGDVISSPLGQKLVQAKNVTILEGYKVTKVMGNGFCNKVVVEAPNGNKKEIKTDGTFVEMALIPNSQIVSNLVELDDKGCIVVDSQCRTHVPGVFAAGDVTDTTEQVLVAVGEGAKAALSAYEYLLPSL